ncbi:Protein XRI1 [Acorus calamus]|uniref:Protein XRI1 n=1 Tax=Acorus calamus TaxID=4465 RepID=A0AAV9BZ89_ACOCL|nr:Protein XRI1 [Acorus calamus]
MMDCDNNGDDLWNLQEDLYCLEGNSRLDISQYLWDEVNQQDDSLLYMLEDQTPTKDFMDFGYDFCDVVGEKSIKEFSSQSKRRRMLQFTSPIDSAIHDEQVTPALETSMVDGDPIIEDGMPENLEWDPGLPPCASGYDRMNHSSGGWMTNCLNNTEMPFIPEEMNVSGDSGDQVDTLEYCNVPPNMEAERIQVTPQATCKIIKGKKSYRPAKKLVTSVAYPFALIKPCGVQGDVTLRDINQRLHAPLPSKSNNLKEEDPFLSYPTSAFSGKPVVTKTKIRTEGGKGSITIMRTRG